MAKRLYLGCDERNAHVSTQQERWRNPTTGASLTTTQVWTWSGGDAIVVVCNTLRQRNSSAVVIRVGKKITVISDASLNSAMQAVGLNPSDFKIFPAKPKKA